MYVSISPNQCRGKVNRLAPFEICKCNWQIWAILLHHTDRVWNIIWQYLDYAPQGTKELQAENSIDFLEAVKTRIGHNQQPLEYGKNITNICALKLIINPEINVPKPIYMKRKPVGVQSKPSTCFNHSEDTWPNSKEFCTLG